RAAEELDTLMCQFDSYPQRKQRFLNHLLARFAESFTDYAIVMYQLYNKTEVEDALIRHKARFLKDYPLLSSGRARAFNAHPDAEKWDTENVSGLERRLARLAGIDDYRRKNLAGWNHQTDIQDGQYSWRLQDEQGAPMLESSLLYDSQMAVNDALLEDLLLTREPSNYSTAENGGWHFILVKTVEINGAAQQQELARSIMAYPSEGEAESARDSFMASLESSPSPEGFYLIEHVLLHPTIEEGPAPGDFFSVDKGRGGEFPDPLDPYSFRVTVILPGWTARFSSIPFRQFLENRIRMELPAHIMARICWIRREQMLKFEIRYREWLEEASNPEKRRRFLEALKEVHSVYPEGCLQDCADITEENGQKAVILNRTHLGMITDKQD
ncbi:MAG: hypothetical protein KDD06_25015, partial [Phaeodactylibacter sp.]|nr:hypothetical protein [Phaeodactylibacter sp.]